jgi:hypothetical protein
MSIYLFGSPHEKFQKKMELPPFVPPPFCIFNQDKNTSNSEDIGVKEREEEVRRNETS